MSSGASSSSAASLNSSGGGCIFNASTDLDDINYLLYLEALRLFKDDELSIKRQVEDKRSIYQEVKADYERTYAKYVALLNLAATRTALHKSNYLAVADEGAIKKQVRSIINKLTTGNIVGVLDHDTLALCREKLDQCICHKKIAHLREQLARNKLTVRAIQGTADAIETTLETVTMQGLEHFIEELQQSEKYEQEHYN